MCWHQTSAEADVRLSISLICSGSLERRPLGSSWLARTSCEGATARKMELLTTVALLDYSSAPTSSAWIIMLQKTAFCKCKKNCHIQKCAVKKSSSASHLSTLSTAPQCFGQDRCVDHLAVVSERTFRVFFVYAKLSCVPLGVDFLQTVKRLFLWKIHSDNMSVWNSI